MSNLVHAARHTLQKKKASALLEEIRPAMTAAQTAVLPAGTLTKASNCTLALWPKLTRFLE
jgi:hypothetical protein